ncbi:putative lipid II flippase FtsW [bacterium]|nr:putative lipid II flippase FtsW [bacterium]|tara:strand:- start:2450 stop:3556 length:1107 start_codon:yes stop_codon:yes gene_type:complete
MLKNYLESVEPRILFIFSTIILAIIGLVMVFSSSSIIAMENYADSFFYLKRQSLFLLIGLFIMLICSKINTNVLSKNYKFFYIVGIILLLLVLIPMLGRKSGGATRWIQILSFSIQPIEISKYMLLIFIAQHLNIKNARIKEFKIGVVSTLLPCLPYLFLLLLQPDFGNTVLICITIFGMIILSGARMSHILSLFLLLISSFISLIYIAPYRMKRVMSFLNPYEDPQGSGYQIIQSFVSFAKGKFFGVGLGNSSQKLFYLPQGYNDFIFSIIAEELGFLGSMVIIILFGILIYSGFKMLERAKDLFSRNLISGIIILTSLQIIINISVTIGLMPTKGVPLPLISYGGSSLIFTLFALGLILALDRRRN